MEKGKITVLFHILYLPKYFLLINIILHTHIQNHYYFPTGMIIMIVIGETN